MAQSAAVLGARIELEREVPLALEPPRFYWSHPAAGVRVLALGEAARREAGVEGPAALVASLCAQQVEWLDAGGPQPPGPWLGASAFDPSRPLGAAWEGFAPARFVLPRLLCWSEEGRHFAAALEPVPRNGEPRGAIRARLEAALSALRRRLEPPPPPLPPPPAILLAGPQQAARESWDALVEAALAAIARGALHKVVVARTLEVRAAGAIDPRPALSALERRHPTCRAFCVRGDGGAWFLGATPELLCTVDGRTLSTEALAGTARPAEAALLLQSAKDLREHRWVVEHLREGLQQLAERISPPVEPRVRELANLVHLLTPIEALLREGVSAGQVVAALHPTPAVAGVPGAAALEFLAAREGLERGLYAGLVGLAGAGRTELAVALRSALLRGDQARLFAGAGIVDGSSAEAEWRETELKASAVLAALGASTSRLTGSTAEARPEVAR